MPSAHTHIYICASHSLSPVHLPSLSSLWRSTTSPSLPSRTSSLLIVFFSDTALSPLKESTSRASIRASTISYVSLFVSPTATDRQCDASSRIYPTQPDDSCMICRNMQYTYVCTSCARFHFQSNRIEPQFFMMDISSTSSANQKSQQMVEFTIGNGGNEVAERPRWKRNTF